MSLRYDEAGAQTLSAILHAGLYAPFHKEPICRIAGEVAEEHADLHHEPVDRHSGIYHATRKQAEAEERHPAEQAYFKRYYRQTLGLYGVLPSFRRSHLGIRLPDGDVLEQNTNRIRQDEAPSAP